MGLNPTDFTATPTGSWLDNAGSNLAGSFTLPDGTTDEYDFVTVIVGDAASAVSPYDVSDGVLIGTVAFTVNTDAMPGEHFLSADGGWCATVCTR